MGFLAFCPSVLVTHLLRTLYQCSILRYFLLTCSRPVRVLFASCSRPVRAVITQFLSKNHQ